MKNFGERLKNLRLEKKISGQELATQLSVDKSTISKWESDNRSPDADALRELADILNVSTDYLLGRTEDPRPFPPEDTRTIQERWESPHNKSLQAMYEKLQDLTDEQIEETIDFIDFLRSKSKKNSEGC